MVVQTTKEKSVCAVKQNKKSTNDISEKAISMYTLIKLFIWKSFSPATGKKQFRKQWGFNKTDLSNDLIVEQKEAGFWLTKRRYVLVVNFGFLIKRLKSYEYEFKKGQRDFIITASGAFLCLQSTELKKTLDRATYCLHAPKFEAAVNLLSFKMKH